MAILSGMDDALPDTRRLELTGPAGKLEARLDRPRDGVEPRFVAVFGHPDPLQGGTMFNNVVVHATRTLVQSGAAVLRFNFRGVGRSEGEHADGVGERDDYLAALRRLKELHPDVRPRLAAGFSFGAIRAMECAGEADLYLGVAPPITLRKYVGLPRVEVPSALVIAGDDELVPRPDADFLDQHFPIRMELEVVEGSKHLFHGRLEALRDAVHRSVTRLLAASD